MKGGEGEGGRDWYDESVGHEVEETTVEAHVSFEDVESAELQGGGAQGAGEGRYELLAGGHAEELAQHVVFFFVFLLLLLLLRHLIQRCSRFFPSSEQPARERRHERHAPASERRRLLLAALWLRLRRRRIVRGLDARV